MPFICRTTRHPVLQTVTTTALMAAVYFSYCVVVSFATTEGAGWQFFLLALSSAIPALGLLCMLNAIYLSQWPMTPPLRLTLTIALDIASIALIAWHVDYNNLINMEF